MEHLNDFLLRGVFVKISRITSIFVHGAYPQLVVEIFSRSVFFTLLPMTFCRCSGVPGKQCPESLVLANFLIFRSVHLTETRGNNNKSLPINKDAHAGNHEAFSSSLFLERHFYRVPIGQQFFFPRAEIRRTDVLDRDRPSLKRLRDRERITTTTLRSPPNAGEKNVVRFDAR